MLLKLTPGAARIEYVETLRKGMLTDLPESANLDNLGWETSDQAPDDDTLRGALRFGLPTPSGLIVDIGDLVALRRPNELRSAARAARDARPAMRRVIADPEMLAAESESAAAVERAQAGFEDEADAKRAAVLAVPVRDDLAKHWSSLGGRLPDPA